MEDTAAVLREQYTDRLQVTAFHQVEAASDPGDIHSRTYRPMTSCRLDRPCGTPTSTGC